MSKDNRVRNMCGSCNENEVVKYKQESKDNPYYRTNYICLSCGEETFSINVPIISTRFTSNE